MRIKRNSLHESQRKRHLTRNAESNAPLWPEAAIARQESVWLEKAAREPPELAAILSSRLHQCTPLARLTWRPRTSPFSCM